MDRRGGDPDVLSAVRIASLLDSVRALHAAPCSSEVETSLRRHIVALLRDLVRADEAFLLLGAEDGSQAGPHEQPKRGTRTPNNQRRVTEPLIVRGKPAGALVLERHNEGFDEAELLVISAVARIASTALENAEQMETLESEVHRLRRQLQFEDNMAGQSEALEKLRNTIRRVAVSDTTVLIVGESGTGKELVARSIHGQSARASEAFVAINCGALTATLLESELFGHEKGAFTGASALKRGLLETAQGGTVFLDEIGEMAASAQASLLRVLQNKELQRVGGTQAIPLNVRVVAATNRDLEAAVRTGSFRKDLFYRLNVVTLRTPALRERPEDIVPLAHHFVRWFGPKCGRPGLAISANALRVLQAYDWPGNVRELENAIEHAAVLGSGNLVEPEDLPEKLLGHWGEAMPGEVGMLQSAVNSAKRSAVKRAFEIAGQDHVEAARFLGVHPNYLYRLLKNLNFEGF
jgi:transcriptional regulator with GAF, ATPase, and Fis domain